MPKPPRGILGMLSPTRPLVIGTVHEPTGLAIARRGGRSLIGVDLLEARLDCLHGKKFPEVWPLPVIATARHPREGGSNSLPLTTRRILLESSLEWASAIDVELRSSSQLSTVVAGAHREGLTVILSHHDFKATPSLRQLDTLAVRAASEGADVFKVATLLRDRSDLVRLIEFQSRAHDVPVVAMGMGVAGRFSRIVLGGLGAPLCYGWLGRPQVPGQWPASGLRALLNEVLPA